MHIDININANNAWIWWILVWVAHIVAGAFAGSGKQAAFGGGLRGAFLGPLGVVAALGLDGRHLCEICTGRIDGHEDDRNICQHCQSPLYWDPITGKPFPDRSDQFREKNEPSAKTSKLKPEN